ncbi:hypothetical protein L2218_16460, partial [Xanthomonas perforans]|nr:hypothetical protein [Xanthomonas perforans]
MQASPRNAMRCAHGRRACAQRSGSASWLHRGRAMTSCKRKALLVFCVGLVLLGIGLLGLWHVLPLNNYLA